MNNFQVIWSSAMCAVKRESVGGESRGERLAQDAAHDTRRRRAEVLPS